MAVARSGNPHAREATWVQVSADGQTAFVGLLHPNDKRSIAATLKSRLSPKRRRSRYFAQRQATGPHRSQRQVRTVRLTAEGPQLSSVSARFFSALACRRASIAALFSANNARRRCRSALAIPDAGDA